MSLKASEIAQFLNARLCGEDIDVSGPSSLREDAPKGCVLFANGKITLPDQFGQFGMCLLLVSLDKADQMPKPHIAVENPRLAFSKVLSEFFMPKAEPSVHATACIEDGAIIGSRPRIGAFAHIGPDVVLGDDVAVGVNTIIAGKTVIGDGTIIRSNCVIGEPGFGFERDEQNVPQRVPHFGGVQIGANCEIGALNTVVCGTLDPTIIKDHVKTDDHVHIAHNCVIGNRVLITAAAELSGSVHVEDDVWIGPNAAITNGVHIGSKALIGIGAVITQDVAANMTMGTARARPVAVKK